MNCLVHMVKKSHAWVKEPWKIQVSFTITESEVHKYSSRFYITVSLYKYRTCQVLCTIKEQRLFPEKAIELFPSLLVIDVCEARFSSYALINTTYPGRLKAEAGVTTALSSIKSDSKCGTMLPFCQMLFVLENIIISLKICYVNI